MNIHSSKGLSHGGKWLTPSASYFGQLHVNKLTRLTGPARPSVRETDRSSPHASVLRMLHANEYVGLLRMTRPK